MSAGARALLRWMIWRAGKKKQLWWSQVKMAADLGMKLRTLQRKLSELVQSGAVASIRRGRTSCLYKLAESCGKMLSSGGSSGGSSAAYLLTENNTEKVNSYAQPERKPQATAKTFYYPAEPEYIAAFCGAARYLQCPNAERLAAAARSAGLPADIAGEVARAIDLQPRWRSPHRSIRNPLAYRLAVMERELLGVRRIPA